MFGRDWSSLHLNFFGIPLAILPRILPSHSSTEYGTVDPKVFEDFELPQDNKLQIPITAVLADQGASAYGLGCVNKGDMKITLGTGTFLNINTGSSPHCTFDGLVIILNIQHSIKKWWLKYSYLYVIFVLILIYTLVACYWMEAE